MQTRTRNAIGLAAITAAAAVGLTLLSRSRPEPDLRPRALDAVPNGALLVAVADLDALRASPVGAPLLQQGREIPGLGRVRDVCGFDPIDTLREIAVAIPAAGDSGDFGLVAAGAVDADALIACASKVIEARGGHAAVTTIGSFQAVRDTSLSSPGGEIAVRPNGPILLGAGVYLRAMIDAADRRAPTIRASIAHSSLARDVGDAAIRVTVVLSPEQRDTLAQELRNEGALGSPARSIVAGAFGLSLGPEVGLHGVIACEAAAPCLELAGSLRRAKDERAADTATRLIGVGEVLEKLRVEAVDDRVHARVQIPAEQAKTLVERVITLRSFRHPMPAPGAGETPADRRRDAGAPSQDAGAPSDRDAGAPSDQGIPDPRPDEVVRPPRGKEKRH